MIKEEKPQWHKASNLWKSPTYQVEEYITILENRIVELENELNAVKHNRDLTIKWAKGEM